MTQMKGVMKGTMKRMTKRMTKRTAKMEWNGRMRTLGLRMARMTMKQMVAMVTYRICATSSSHWHNDMGSTAVVSTKSQLYQYQETK